MVRFDDKTARRRSMREGRLVLKRDEIIGELSETNSWEVESFGDELCGV